MNERQLQHYAGRLAYETDSWDLEVMVEAGEQVVIVDARAPEAYRKERISGAINRSHRQMSDATTQHIDRVALVVTYCDGIGCNASTKGALNMTKLGFRVRGLLGGLDWWKRDGHPTEGESATASAGACGCA
jgi:rhodanese-related sulfurtransferase